MRWSSWTNSWTQVRSGHPSPPRHKAAQHRQRDGFRSWLLVWHAAACLMCWLLGPLRIMLTCFNAFYRGADMKGLEWSTGSGTMWLLTRLHSLVSIEHHASWVRRVQQTLERIFPASYIKVRIWHLVRKRAAKTKPPQEDLSRGSAFRLQDHLFCAGRAAIRRAAVHGAVLALHRGKIMRIMSWAADKSEGQRTRLKAALGLHTKPNFCLCCSGGTCTLWRLRTSRPRRWRRTMTTSSECVTECISHHQLCGCLSTLSQPAPACLGRRDLIAGVRLAGSMWTRTSCRTSRHTTLFPSMAAPGAVLPS